MRKTKSFLLAALILGLTFLTILAGCAGAPAPAVQSTGQAKSIQPSVQQVTMQDAVKAWKEKNAVFIDVRTPEEYREGHVSGAKLIPLAELENRLSEIPRDKQVLLICRSGSRSGKANLILQQRGLTNTRSVNGGMLDWPEAVEK